MIPKVTLVVTSCGRFDLLEKTLVSFRKFNQFPIDQAILVEDSEHILDKSMVVQALGMSSDQVKIIQNEKNLGQIASIDKAYLEVKNPYIFHCEDDWEFYESGFIESSLKILEKDQAISNVWLRAHNDTNGHPISGEGVVEKSDCSYYLMSEGYRNVWHGFTLNPGLRRMSDYKRLSPYSQLPQLDRFKGKSSITESDLSIHYHRMGYRAAITGNSLGYVKHLGYSRHIPSHWENKYLAMLKNFIKRFFQK